MYGKQKFNHLLVKWPLWHHLPSEKAEHILELLDSEPDNHRAIRENTEELVFFLQDQLFSSDDSAVH